MIFALFVIHRIRLAMKLTVFVIYNPVLVIIPALFLWIVALFVISLPK